MPLLAAAIAPPMAAVPNQMLCAWELMDHWTLVSVTAMVKKPESLKTFQHLQPHVEPFQH